MKLNRIVIAALALSATAAIAGGNKHTAQNTSSEPSGALSAQSSTNMGTNGSAATSASASMSGQDSETIRQAQQALNEKGFDVGSPDGHAGPKTKKALKKFQQAQGINQSGSLDGQTLAALGVQGGGSAQASGFGPTSGQSSDATTAQPSSAAPSASAPAQPSGSTMAQPSTAAPASPTETATSSPGTNAAQNPGKSGNPATRSGQ